MAALCVFAMFHSIYFSSSDLYSSLLYPYLRHSKTITSKMSIEELLSRLSNLDVDTPDEPYHVLNFQYPAEELLPEDVPPHLVPPRNMASRNQPPDGPRLLGMTDFSIYSMISSMSNPEPIRGVREHERLLSAVGELSRVQGTSVLKIVQYLDTQSERGEIFCRVRLETTTSSGFQIVRSFELNIREMNALRDHLYDYQGLRLLEHLIFCESDRAWYHVQANLRSIPMWEYEENWIEWWATDLDKDFGKTFRNQFVYLRPQQGSDSREVIELGTRCGHSVTVDRVAFESITLEDCISANCQRCGKPILDDDTREDLKTRYDTEKAVEFIKKNELWIRLDHDIVDGEFAFAADEVLAALELSLRSFTPPRLACPPGFSFGDYPATKAILENFRVNFEDSEDILRTTGKDLARRLYQTAMNTTIGSSTVPIGQVVRRPRFKEDLEFWLRRAVNLANASCNKKAEEESLLEAMSELNLQGASVGSIERLLVGMGIGESEQETEEQESGEGDVI